MLKTMMRAAVFAHGAMLAGCAADMTTPDQSPARDAEQATTESQSFTLRVDGFTTQDRTNCNDVGLWGGAGLTFVCTLPFLPIFF